MVRYAVLDTATTLSGFRIQDVGSGEHTLPGFCSVRAM